MKNKKMKWIIVIILILVLIQFYPVERTNPPVTAEVKAPVEVMNILKNSCYDCHSNETVWPWYSYVAPVSWFVAGDVEEGRNHMNFSEWGNKSGKKRSKMKEEIWEEVSEEAMPMKTYTWLHSGTSLNSEQKNILKEWTQSRELFN